MTGRGHYADRSIPSSRRTFATVLPSTPQRRPISLSLSPGWSRNSSSTRNRLTSRGVLPFSSFTSTRCRGSGLSVCGEAAESAGAPVGAGAAADFRTPSPASGTGPGTGADGVARRTGQEATSGRGPRVKACRASADGRQVIPRSLSILLIAVALGGCGAVEDSTREAASAKKKSASDAATVLGAITQQDKLALRRYGQITDEWPSQFGKLTSAEENEDVADMRVAVDALGDIATRAQDTVLDMDTASVRRDFDAHAEGYLRVASALDRYVAYYEDDTTAADSAAEGDLSRDIEEASLALQRADRNVASRILEGTPAEDRPALREKMRAAQERFEKQASGTTP